MDRSYYWNKETDEVYWLTDEELKVRLADEVLTWEELYEDASN